MRSHWRLLTAVLSGMAFLALSLWMATRLPQPVRAGGPWYVAPGGIDSSDCLSPSTPCATINATIDKASSEVVLIDKSVTVYDYDEAGRPLTVTLANGVQTGYGYDSAGRLVDIQHTQGEELLGEYEYGLDGVGNRVVVTETLLAATSAPTQVILQPGPADGIDTYIDQDFPDNSDGDLNACRIGKRDGASYPGGVYRSLLRFDLSAIPSGAVITHASLEVYVDNYDYTPNTFQFYRTTSSWDEGATWNTQPSYDSSTIWGSLLSSTPYRTWVKKIVDITGIISAWHDGTYPNYGFYIKGTNEGYWSRHWLYSSDGAVESQRPKLVIEYYMPQPIELSTKTASQSSVFVGDPLTYMIVLTNSGDTDIVDVRITDTLPALLTYSGHLASTGGDVGYANGVITWTGSVQAGEMVTITFGTTVSQMAAFASITNSAVISGGGLVVTRSATVYADARICNLSKHSGNPVLSAGQDGSWDSDDVWGPTVLQEEGAYKMWYTGDDGSSPWRIGLATSIDGSTWTKDIANNPVLSPTQPWEANGVWAGAVISDSGQYRMWYTGYDSNWVGRIGYATSTNGVSWAKYAGNPVLEVEASGTWEDEDVRGPTVIKEGGTYHMWYTGYDGMTFRIGYATSSDGIAWTKDVANPVLDVGPPGDWDWLDVYGTSVVAHNDAYLMWYSGDTLPPAWQTGYAVSSDGTSWSRKEMLIPEGAPGTFDVNSADYPSVILDGGEFKVWYSGVNDANTYSIGYATAQICGASEMNRVYLPIVVGGGQPPCPADYADDFSDPTSGWPEWEDSDVKFAYTGGQYQIWVRQGSQSWSVTPGVKGTDFTAAVSARRTTGSSGGYGIVFGINEDWTEYYRFIVERDYYSIWKYDSGWFLVRDWTRSGHLNAGTGWNRLKVIRNGGSIAVYVNDHHLATVTDSSFTGLRRIGLTAYSPYSSSAGSMDARFDDFALYPANCGVSAAGMGSGFEIGRPEINGGPAPPGFAEPQ